MSADQNMSAGEMSRSDALNLLVDYTPYGSEGDDLTHHAVTAIVEAFRRGRRAAIPAAAPPAPAAQPVEPPEQDEDVERVAFYAVLNEATNLTGYKPAAFDLWLMARGRMTTNGRRIAQPVEPSDDARDAALRELVGLEDQRIRLRNLHNMGHGTDWDDYHQRIQPAWDAARAVLSASKEKPRG